jgi:hypothetical protein
MKIDDDLHEITLTELDGYGNKTIDITLSNAILDH